MAEDLYKAFQDNTLSWIYKSNGRIWGNSILVQAPISPIAIDILAQDINKTLKSPLNPKNLSPNKHFIPLRLGHGPQGQGPIE